MTFGSSAETKVVVRARASEAILKASLIVSCGRSGWVGGGLRGLRQDNWVEYEMKGKSKN